MGSVTFAGVAAALVEGGLPAVIAMQLPITDRAALSFSGALYRGLSQGWSVDSAVALGRTVLRFELDSPEWITPVLFMRVSDGRLFAPETEIHNRQAGQEAQFEADLIESQKEATQVIANEVGSTGDAAGVRDRLKVKSRVIRATDRSTQIFANRLSTRRDD